MKLDEKIEIEKYKLEKMIDNSNGNLLYEVVQKQSRKIDKLIVKYIKSINTNTTQVMSTWEN